MKMIVFVSNFLNHHQHPVASALYRMTDGEYCFIETEPMPEWIKKNGYSEYDNLPWLVQTWKSKDKYDEAVRLILDADVVVWGLNLFMPQIRQRLKANKLTFEFGERWLKRGLLNLLSVRLIKSQLYYHLIFKKDSLFRLNASAYAANDFALMHSYKNHMFKWGYFTPIQKLEPTQNNVLADGRVLRILFVARFLKWKHPELPVQMAARLKMLGYSFELNMFGSGPEEKNIRHLIASLGVDDVVTLCGNRPNKEILQEMRDHDIFIFTSDKHEGWGAVVNEAMSQRCALVASKEVGSVPFLISDGVNGLIYKNNSLDELTEKVKFLLDNPHKCSEFGDRAYQTITNVWAPENAAKNFLMLTEALLNKKPCPIEYGPCSKAILM